MQMSVTPQVLQTTEGNDKDLAYQKKYLSFNLWSQKKNGLIIEDQPYTLRLSTPFTPPISHIQMAYIQMACETPQIFDVPNNKIFYMIFEYWKAKPQSAQWGRRCGPLSPKNANWE